MVAKQQGQQFVQCFQLTIDDLKAMIKDAVKSVIPPPTNGTNITLGVSASNPEDDLITPKEVCKIIKISSTTLWRFNREEILKQKVKIGRKVYYSKKDVYDFLNNNTQ